MFTLQEKIQNLETILSSQENLSSENRTLLLKEIERLRELVNNEPTQPPSPTRIH